MRTLRSLLVFFCVSLSIPSLAVGVNQAAPEWSLDSVDGRTINYPQDTAGKVSILFFWASWCPYCHVVMPYLQKIKQDYAADGIEIYAINFKDDGDPAQHMKEAGHDFIVLPIGDLVADDYSVWSAPGLFVVDQQGVIQYRRGSTKAPPGQEIAELWDGEMRTALQRILKKTTLQ